MAAEGQTFPQLLAFNARTRGAKHAIREKTLGIWQAYTWKEQHEKVRDIAAGLHSLGLKAGDKIAIIGDNRPDLYWSIVASQALGAVPVPVYQDSAAKELRFVLEHAEVRFAIVEDQEQVDKLLEIKDDFEKLETIVYTEARGMRHYEQSFLHAIEAVMLMGDEFNREHPDFYDDHIAKGKGEDTAIMLYTSGTTGQPKGVVLTFDNLVSMSRLSVEIERLREDEETLAYLPMAWVGDNIFSIGQSYVAGFCVNCPESPATVLQDLREIGPTYFFAPPRIFENLLTTVTIRMEDASWLKRSMFRYFMAHAREVGPKLLSHQPVSLGARLKYWLGEILVYGPLKNALGFSRIRRVYTAGEAIGPDIFDFYRSIGLNMKQLYGQTEASVFVTIQPDNEIRPDTVGIAVKGVELKIDEKTREVLYRSPGVFKEYYKNPEATRETKTEDGWVHTGDAGIIGEDGHLRIIDRAKDVGALRDGTMFAPKYLENKLKFFPSINEAVTFGDGRDFATAMISIDMDAVGSWAERNNVAYSSFRELAAKPEVYTMVKEAIEKVNRDLAEDPALVGSQIKRFCLLHKELDADDGELTRTRKVRRRFVAERYASLIDAFYSGKTDVHIEVETTFEDGRSGVTAGDIVIADAATFGAAQMKKAS